MKKALLFLLLLMSFSMFVISAGAQTEVSKWETTAADIILNPETEVIAVKDNRKPNYVLMDVDGNKIADTGVSEMRSVAGKPMFTFIDKGTGLGGVMNDQGKILLSPEYEWFEVLSDKWVVGLVCKNGSENEYDFRYNNYTGSGDVYLILERADFYFDGNKVGSLEYDDMKGFGKAYGNYVSVLNRKDNFNWYSSEWQKSPYESKNPDEYNHVREDGINMYYHQGTGQKAFMEGCTLTSDEVINDYLCDDGAVYDLQGNLVFTAKHDYMEGPFHFSNGYKVFPIYLEDHEVLVDESGNEVIAAKYYDIDPETVDSGYPLVQLKTDGNRFYGGVSLDGNETCETKYTDDEYRMWGTFMYNKVPDENGYYTVVSTAVGEFPEKYKYVRVPVGSLSIVVENDNGEGGVIDLFGRTVVPFSKDYTDYKINYAGTVVIFETNHNTYEIYHISLAK